MTHGIKSLAQDLAKHGRYGDTMVAHINPQEAAMLKAMGGSGTINPVTGLPEFLSLGSVFKGATNAVKGIVQPVYNATLKNVPGVDQALVGLDKTVGKAIPGGWGTVGTIAASMIPGVGPLAMAGLGALNGSGVMRKDGKFNLQGALMGGAMAYGMSSLASGLEAAGGGGAGSVASDTASIASNLGVEGASTGAGSQAAMLAQQNAGMGLEGLNSINAGANQAIQAAQSAGAVAPGVNTFTYTPSGEMVPSNVSADITGAAAPTTVTPQPSTLSNLATGYGQNVSAVGEGLKNLSGFGADGSAAAARAAFSGTGATLQNTALPIVVGGTGLMALKEQEDALNQANAAGTVNQEDYNNQMARINDAKARASAAMNENPYKFAMGGTVANPPDDQTGMMNQTPMQNFEQGGIMSMVDRTVPQQMFAVGGMPGYSEGGELKARKERELLDMLDASFKAAPAGQNIEGIGWQNSPPAVSGRLGANIDALGGNIRAGVSGNAMMTPDKKIITMPGMMDVGYKGQVGPGTLNVNLQRAIQSQAGRGNPYAVAANYSMPFAAGGNVSRFLSGGGDGLSDDIPAIIGDKQPAKLADGEFVVSSDVVSNLGGGSSKAGAKKLYAMMDRVRKQAHGTKKQIRPVSTKALPA